MEIKYFYKEQRICVKDLQFWIERALHSNLRIFRLTKKDFSFCNLTTSFQVFPILDQSKRGDKTDQTDHSHWMEYNCQTSLKSSRASCDANKAKSEEVNTSIF